jgi:nicotinate phosphoribosyltransferase
VDGEMRGDVIATSAETLAGEPLLVPVMREGRRVASEPLERLRARVAAELESLPAALRNLEAEAAADAYPVSCSERLEDLTERALAGHDVEAPA